MNTDSCKTLKKDISFESFRFSSNEFRWRLDSGSILLSELSFENGLRLFVWDVEFVKSPKTSVANESLEGNLCRDILFFFLWNFMISEGLFHCGDSVIFIFFSKITTRIWRFETGNTRIIIKVILKTKIGEVK